MLMLQLSATVHDLICFLSTLFVCWRRTRDAQKITKRSPFPPAPFNSDPFTGANIFINIRSIEWRRNRITHLQLLNNPTLSIQLSISFYFFRDSPGLMTWPRLYRAQSIFSLRELDQSSVWFGATFLAADLWVFIVFARDQSRDERSPLFCFLLGHSPLPLARLGFFSIVTTERDWSLKFCNITFPVVNKSMSSLLIAEHLNNQAVIFTASSSFPSQTQVHPRSHLKGSKLLNLT